ncbi:MAG: GTPase [Nanoarchaeota archaeon]
MRVKYVFSSRRTRKIDPHNKHRQEYPELAKEVISASDVIFEVLDARFVDQTRNKGLEEFAREQGKKIIYVINKADLVKEKNALELEPHIFVSTIVNTGRRALRALIRIEAKRAARKIREEPSDEKEHLEIQKQGVGYRKFLKIGKEIHVGVIGYPNVGKSSLINMLSGKGAARTSPRAGFTRGIQKVRFARGILLLDTPGVMSDEDAAASQSAHLKKHAIIGVRTYDSMKNPDFIVAEIMHEHPGLFESFYEINADGDAEVLLDELGRRWRFLIKGGLVDIDRTARLVLKDWQEGKIRDRHRQPDKFI